MNYPYWGYGPQPPPPQQQYPQNNRPSISRKELDRIAKNAVRDAMRLRDKDKIDKRKRRDEREKKSKQARANALYFIEIFILGALAQPFVGMLYNYYKGKYGLP